MPSVTFSMSAGRQADQRAVVIDRPIEVASGEQEAAREHQIAEAAVGEVEAAAGLRHLVGEAQEPGTEPGARRVLNRPDDPRQLAARTRSLGRLCGSPPTKRMAASASGAA